MMRKLFSATFTISIVLLLMYFIYNKHYIQYNACYKFPMLKTSFYPDAYKFINTREDFEKYTELIDNAINLSSIFEIRKLDFEKYTYILVFGAPVKNMYYSLKTTFCDDKSPSYARARKYKKKCVFIEYEKPTGHIYLYEINKDESLTGFNGI